MAFDENNLRTDRDEREARRAAERHPTFRAAWWLPGPHLQTVWGPLTRPNRMTRLAREVLPTPDGDEIVLDHLDGSAGTPRVVLLHGLEGSSFSPYMQGLLSRLAARGWQATVFHFRSCAQDPSNGFRQIPNRRPRLYHSGETGDFDFVIRELRRREPATPAAAVGISLGGNVLLKWLGENPGQDYISAAATLSVPYDLASGARQLENPAGRFYVRRFLRTLRAKTIDLTRRFPELQKKVDVDAALRARDFHAFDDAATAPLHGFAGAADYYQQCSSIRFVPRITTPTLSVNADDDPFLPAEVVEEVRRIAPPPVQVRLTHGGGHVGFVAGSFGQPQYWAEDLVAAWLWSQLPR